MSIFDFGKEPYGQFMMHMNLILFSTTLTKAFAIFNKATADLFPTISVMELLSTLPPGVLFSTKIIRMPFCSTFFTAKNHKRMITGWRATYERTTNSAVPIISFVVRVVNSLNIFRPPLSITTHGTKLLLFTQVYVNFLSTFLTFNIFCPCPVTSWTTKLCVEPTPWDVELFPTF